MDHTIDTVKMWPNEKKLFDNLTKTPSITKALDNRQEKLSTYVDFIQNNNLLDKTLEELVYTTPYDQSIFANKPDLPPSIKLTNWVNALMLKRIMRVLISGVDAYDLTDPDGANHTKNYKSWVLWQDANKTTEDAWKKKKLKDLVEDISKKF